MGNCTSAELIRTAIDQGFPIKELMGRTGVRVISKTDPKASHVVYFNSSGSHTYENNKSALKRLGVVFPVEHQRKAKVVELKQPKEAREKSMATMNATATAQGIVALPPIEQARKALNDAMNALANAEAALQKVDEQMKAFNALREAMRAFGS